ncbi:hypothetical protein JKY72_06360 [Candidatus Gracilibacteria bacterium]|nr:hypothetical protein [Candidatus Gracilibacteria bacterium]
MKKLILAVLAAITLTACSPSEAPALNDAEVAEFTFEQGVVDKPTSDYSSYSIGEFAFELPSTWERSDDSTFTMGDATIVFDITETDAETDVKQILQQKVNLVDSSFYKRNDSRKIHQLSGETEKAAGMKIRDTIISAVLTFTDPVALAHFDYMMDILNNE